MNKNIFGDYETIDFSNVETVGDVGKILNPIFTSNPHFRKNTALYYNYGGNDTLELIKHLVLGHILIHRYRYTLPKLPNEKNKMDEVKYNTFYKWSKAKYDTLPLLYWYADSFLNSNGYSLYNLSNVSKNMMVVKNNYESIKEAKLALNRNRYEEFRTDKSNYTFLDERVSVYIGEIDTSKINNEIHAGNKYILVFPYFLDEDVYSDTNINEKKEVYCYLLEIKDIVIENHKKEFLEISRRVQESMNKFF